MTRRNSFLLPAVLFCFFRCLVVPETFAQSPPVLFLQVTGAIPVVQVTGDLGTACTLQFSTNLSAGGAWQSLSNFTLLNSPASVLDPSRATNQQRFYRVMLVAPTNAAWIPAGTFTMGSPTNELLRAVTETQHVVTLTKNFYLGKFPVTQGSYLSVMNTNPSYFTPANGFSTDLSRPVEQVSWSDATNYCAKLTQQERAAGRIFTNWTYRLPTEAEWEYAGRAGTTTPFYTGTNLLSGMANFNVQFEYVGGVGLTNSSGGTALNRTSAGGNYAPNARGLYDLAGNVWAWCADWSGSYSTNSVADPQGPATGTKRVLRGGAFNSNGGDCRSAKRDSTSPSLGANTISFRVLLSGP